MFTGLITDIATVERVDAGQPHRITLATNYEVDGIALGASIACDGACLTVAAKGAGWFMVEASPETLARTTLGKWEKGRRVNCERALRVGDELGGHLVAGHVDGIGRLLSAEEETGSTVWQVEAPSSLTPLIAPKGSVALDGVSLTVNEVEASRFTLTLIPHTLSHTTLGQKRPGEALNLEIDLIARYVARMMAARN